MLLRIIIQQLCAEATLVLMHYNNIDSFATPLVK